MSQGSPEQKDLPGMPLIQQPLSGRVQPLDIFFVSNNEGAARLFPSPHMGHEWFRCVAESFRKSFLEALENEDRYVECSEIASALAFKLMEKGTIYESKREEEWLPVTGVYESRDLVFRALLTLFTSANNTDPEAVNRMMAAPILQKSAPVSAVATLHPPPLPPPSPGFNNSAAQPTLPSSFLPRPLAPPPRVAFPQWPSSIPPKKRRKQNNPLVIGPSILPPVAEQHIPNLVAQAQPFPPLAVVHPPTAPLQLPGNPLDLNKNDVICGRGPEDGVLKTENSGNLLFHSVAVIAREAFAAAPTHEKATYAMQAVEMIHKQVPPGRFLVFSESGFYTEIPLEEARWRAFWTFEKDNDLAHRLDARQPSNPPDVATTQVLAPRQKQDKRPPKQGKGNKEEKPQDKQKEDDKPLSKKDQEEMFRSVPTHLSLVPSKSNRDRNMHPVALIISKPKTEGKALSPKTEAKSEPLDEEERVKRAKRRQEKLNQARAILLGDKTVSLASDGNPFSDIEQRRALAIKELKKRQQRTEIRRRIATWDPGSNPKDDDEGGED